MFTVDNKFEIGEECYSVYRMPTHYECPICKGKGEFEYNGYNIECRQCNRTGKLHNPKQSVLATCKLRIRRVIVSIWKDQMTIKYKVDNIDGDLTKNIRNRGENNLFKTLEEAEEYCVLANTKQITPCL